MTASVKISLEGETRVLELNGELVWRGHETLEVEGFTRLLRFLGCDVSFPTAEELAGKALERDVTKLYELSAAEMCERLTVVAL